MNNTLIYATVLALVLMSTANASTPGPMNPKTTALFTDSEYTFIRQKLYLTDRGENGPDLSSTDKKGFRSLDLAGFVPELPRIWSDLTIQPHKFVSIMAPIALNKDESRLYFFDYDQYQPYNIQTSTWEPAVQIPIREYAMSMFTDTDSGLIYGLKNTPSSPRDLFVFDPSSAAPPYVVSTMPNVTETFVGRGVYSSVRKSLFFYTSGDSTSNLREYNPASKSWTVVAESGDVPAARIGSCFTSAGNTLIVAGGGRRSNGTALPASELGTDALYLFDLTSSTWKRAANSPIGRFGAACVVSGDYLVLFGGARDFTETAEEITDGTLNTFSYYNLKTNLWVAVAVVYGQTPEHAQQAVLTEPDTPPIGPDQGPGPIVFPGHVLSNQRLYIGSDNSTHRIGYYHDKPFGDHFYALNLSVPWPTTASVWIKLSRPVQFEMPVYSPSAQMVANKNESILYFFNYQDVQSYHIATATWSAKMKPAGQLGIEKSLMLDTDEDKIYGVGRLPSTWWGSREQWSLRVCNPVEWTLSIVTDIPAEVGPSSATRRVRQCAQKSFLPVGPKPG
ncbi:hypothetical protein BGZ82_001518 [Podila clonocystis]|nr:hypothetical protein BGZ82_001518 [Podila clonocystis]